MICFTRSILRWGLIGGLALGGITLLIGPERVAAGFTQLRTKAQHIVDSRLSEPLALRRQLEGLVNQYPGRIDEVEGEMRMLEVQIAQLGGDVDTARDVIAYANDGLGRLRTLIARAEAEAEQTARPVAIRFEGIRLNVDEAYSEARRLNNVRGLYEDRLVHDEQQVKFMGEQHRRLSEILTQLKTEYDGMQVQLAQLNRQIDSIERNERLIELTERQQATLASYEKFGQVGNLKQLEAKLAQVRAIQEAQLQRLEKNTLSRDYEARARQHREAQQGGRKNDDVVPANDEPAPPDRSIAWSAPKIIE